MYIFLHEAPDEAHERLLSGASDEILHFFLSLPSSPRLSNFLQYTGTSAHRHLLIQCTFQRRLDLSHVF